MPHAPDILAKITKHFEGKVRACPMCGATEWHLESDAYVFMKWDTTDAKEASGKVDLTKVFPVIVVTCGNCALSYSYPLKQILRGQQDG
jgi:hypothetical protein